MAPPTARSTRSSGSQYRRNSAMSAFVGCSSVVDYDKIFHMPRVRFGGANEIGFVASQRSMLARAGECDLVGLRLQERYQDAQWRDQSQGGVHRPDLRGADLRRP